MTAERNAYTGDATQTPNPAKPRPLADRVPTWFEFHATGWVCSHPHGPDDVTEELGHPPHLIHSYALAHLNEHHPGWESLPTAPAARVTELESPTHHNPLHDLTAASAVLDDALNRVGTLTSELNAARVENARLHRLLDTRDAEYALVIRVGWDGRTQVDGRPGVSLDQAAEWIREIADDTARRAGL